MIGLTTMLSGSPQTAAKGKQKAAVVTPAPTPVGTPVPFKMEEQKTAYLLTGVAKRIQGDYRGAVDDLRIHVSGNDRDSDGHFELALTYALLNEVKPSLQTRSKAIEHFRICYELSPTYQRNMPGNVSPAVVALAAKGRELAGITGEPAAPRPIDAEGVLKLAESQVDVGDLFEAKKNLDDIKLVPPPPQPADRERVKLKIDTIFKERLQKVQGLEATDITEAQSQMSQLLRYFPDESRALETYIRLQIRYSKIAMEDTAGQKIHQTFKNSIDGFMLKGNYRDAFSDVNRMLFNFPRSEYAERKYDEILQRNAAALKAAEESFAAGRLEEARKKFEDLRRDFPDPGSAQDAISAIDEARRKLETTLESEQEKANIPALYATAKELQAKFPSHPKAPEAIKQCLAEVQKQADAANAATSAGRFHEAIGVAQKALAIVPGQASAQTSLEKAREAIRTARKQLWEGLLQVPAGKYVLGASSPPEARPKNKQATLPTFFLDRYPVTNANYRTFVMATGSKPPATWKAGEMDPAKAEFAVGGVSYAEAEAYCQWLGKRLPTEFEWEKAARGPEGLDLPYENAPGRARKAFNPFSEYSVTKYPELVSPFRIEAMIGPTFQWTSSWFKPYPGGEVAAGPAETFKVLRGGSRSPSRPPDSDPLPAMHRERRTPDKRDPDAGFRCAANDAQEPAFLADDPEPEKLRAAPAPAAPPPAPVPSPVAK